MNKRTKLLCTLLNCEEMDLWMLNNVTYDLDEVIKVYRETNWRTPMLNDILHTVIVMGILEILEAAKKRNDELFNKKGTEKEEEEYWTTADCKLDDFSIKCDGIATRVFCVANFAAYKEYLANEVKQFKKKTGLEIEFAPKERNPV